MKAVRENPPLPLPGPGDPFLGLWPRNSNLCLCLQVTFHVCPFQFPCLSLLLQGCFLLGLGPTCIIQDDLISRSLTDLFLNKVNVHRFQVHISEGPPLNPTAGAPEEAFHQVTFSFAA